LDDCLVAYSGLNGQLFGKEEVAAIAFGDFDDVAAIPELGNIFFEDDFHG